MKKETIKRGFKVPHTYVILCIVIIIMTICTYIIPAGQFQRVEDPSTGRNVVDPSSFTYVEQNPVSPFEMVQSIPDGMKDAAGIIFFIFIIGGAFQMISATGAIDAGIGRVAKKLEGRERLIIPIFIILFSILGGTVGMAEEAIVFVPIGIALARALGYDSLVGMSMISLGCACGFSSGFMNPFTVGVAQGIAELPIFSGLGLRLVIWVVMIIVTTLYISRYAKKVKQNPQLSIVRELEEEESDMKLNLLELPEFTNRHKACLVTVIIGLGLMIYNVFNSDWGITQIVTVFLIIGIVSGAIGGMGPSAMGKEFVAGAKGMVFGALIVGVARGILIVMQNGMIIDSMVNYMAASILWLPKSIASVVMMFVQIIINFFIPSGSGQAAATMPIMVPLADLLNITRQTSVLAYQFGDGFTNAIIPTSASLMGTLSVAKVPYEKWLRYVAPIIGLWIIVGAVFMVIASMINYGPF